MRTRSLLPMAVIAGVLAPVAFAGTPITGEVPVNTTSQLDQMAPALAAGGGQYVAAWTDDALGIRARRFTAAGTPLTGELAIAQSSAASSADIDVAADGSFVVAYQELDPTDAGDIHLVRVSADGTAVGGALPVSTDATGDQQVPSVSIAPDGGIVLVWWDESEGRVEGRRFSPTGSPVTGELHFDFDGDVPQVVAQSGGRFVIADFFQDGSDDDVVAQRFGGDGAPLTGRVDMRGPADTFADFTPAAARGPGESVVVAWSSGGEPFWRRFASDLGSGSPVRQGDVSPTLPQQLSSVGMAADGRVVLGWEDDPAAGGAEASVRRFDAADAPLTGPLVANTTLDGLQTWPQVAVQPDGAFAVAWTSDDPPQDGDGAGVYARFYTAPASASPTPSPLPSPSPSPTPVPVAPKFRDFVTFPANKQCVRKLRLRFHDVTKVTVRINGKKVKKPRKTIRKLPRGRFTVKVTLVTKSGAKLSGKRSYRRCR